MSGLEKALFNLKVSLRCTQAPNDMALTLGAVHSEATQPASTESWQR